MLATAIVAAYLPYRAGLTVLPALVLLVAGLAGLLTGLTLARRAIWTAVDTIATSAIVASVFGWLLWLAWPNLLPIGGGVDLTHHLVLIDYIARRWQLIEDPSL